MLYLQLQKDSREKLTLNVVEMRQLPENEKIYFKEEISRLKWTS